MNSTNRVAHAHAIIQGRIAAVVASLPAAERDTKQLPDVSIAVPVDVLVTAREALEGQMPCDAFGLPTAPSTQLADDVREVMLEAVSDVLADAFSDAVTERIAADILTRLSRTHEVRPRGTITDAEVLRAKAAALAEFADAVRMPFTVFRDNSEEPITPGDLMRETAARYLAEAAQEARS